MTTGNGIPVPAYRRDTLGKLYKTEHQQVNNSNQRMPTPRFNHRQQTEGSIRRRPESGGLITPRLDTLTFLQWSAYPGALVGHPQRD